MTKHSKDFIDSFLEPLYYDNTKYFGDYEKEILDIMISLNCNLSYALEVDFDMNNVDKRSVIDLVDYLESKLNGDLNKVNTLMMVYTHQTPDLNLKSL